MVDGGTGAEAVKERDGRVVVGVLWQPSKSSARSYGWAVGPALPAPCSMRRRRLTALSRNELSPARSVITPGRWTPVANGFILGQDGMEMEAQFESPTLGFVGTRSSSVVRRRR